MDSRTAIITLVEAYLAKALFWLEHLEKGNYDPAENYSADDLIDLAKSASTHARRVIEDARGILFEPLDYPDGQNTGFDLSGFAHFLSLTDTSFRLYQQMPEVPLILKGLINRTQEAHAETLRWLQGSRPEKSFTERYCSKAMAGALPSPPGDSIADLLEEKGMSEDDLAARSGLTGGTF